MTWLTLDPPDDRLKALWRSVAAWRCPSIDNLHRFLEDPFDLTPEEHRHILDGCSICRRNLCRLLHDAPEKSPNLAK